MSKILCENILALYRYRDFGVGIFYFASPCNAVLSIPVHTCGSSWSLFYLFQQVGGASYIVMDLVVWNKRGLDWIGL